MAPRGRTGVPPPCVAAEEVALEPTPDLDSFLAGVEQRAFRIARFAIGDEDEALDMVQDAMIKLVKSYAHRPATEWPALFHRILQNRIRDYHRRRTVRQRVMAWMPGTPRAEDGESAPDPIQSAPDPDTSEEPERRAMLDDVAGALEDAVAALPARQREAFLLRAWEGLNVADTAKAMGRSQGSVKTHYSRAIHALRARLGDS